MCDARWRKLWSQMMTASTFFHTMAFSPLTSPSRAAQFSSSPGGPFSKRAPLSSSFRAVLRPPERGGYAAVVWRRLLYCVAPILCVYFVGLALSLSWQSSPEATRVRSRQQSEGSGGVENPPRGHPIVGATLPPSSWLTRSRPPQLAVGDLAPPLLLSVPTLFLGDPSDNRGAPRCNAAPIDVASAPWNTSSLPYSVWRPYVEEPLPGGACVKSVPVNRLTIVLAGDDPTEHHSALMEIAAVASLPIVRGSCGVRACHVEYDVERGSFPPVEELLRRYRAPACRPDFYAQVVARPIVLAPDPRVTFYVQSLEYHPVLLERCGGGVAGARRPGPT